MEIKFFSQNITVFHGRTVPEIGSLVGYGALIEVFKLEIPMPFKLALISTKNRQYKTEEWQVFTPRHRPAESLYKQLIFALRYEGVNLLFFKKLFERLSVKEIEELVQIEPLGQYSRKIWFLYEWLFNQQLNIPNLKSGNFVALIDGKIQYAIQGSNVSRQRIVNNLPGTPNFCPLIFKTEKLEKYIEANLEVKKSDYLKNIRKDALQRASAFLLLKDSKASFTIEGENPTNKRAVLWGKTIGQAGTKNLSKEELIRLQQMVIENSRFVKMGFRKEAGFVGEHDRMSGEPIPEHISAKWQDVEELINGLIESFERMEQSSFNAVLIAANIAFGFVFIHPFVDGNGRIHRYLIHHILAKMNFAQQGIIFPISASILNHITDYRKVLESYSHSLLEFIKWQKTENNNVEVLNNTIDLYKYFDATLQAEFLYDCVNDTLENVIPDEVNYLRKFDEMKYFLENTFEMPDKMVALLIRFLEQNQGLLSKRAQKNEFVELTADEIISIEGQFKEIFLED
ncbi:Fic family protein [Lutibacter citreus]|uniref:Fic family protein n=1 Tax=Lutibacter citreus TaxID=2138210 RepID=UPI000DBE141E|nr:Fic family protein [Lutibacter citreus]